MQEIAASPDTADMLIGMAIFYGIAIIKYINLSQFYSSAELVTAKVLETYYASSHGTDQGGDHMLKVEFKNQHGQLTSTSMFGTGHEKEGDEIKIYYSLKNPEKAKLANKTYAFAFPITMFVIGTGFLISYII